MTLADIWQIALKRVDDIPFKFRYQYCMNLVRRYGQIE